MPCSPPGPSRPTACRSWVGSPMRLIPVLSGPKPTSPPSRLSFPRRSSAASRTRPKRMPRRSPRRSSAPPPGSAHESKKGRLSPIRQRPKTLFWLLIPIFVVFLVNLTGPEIQSGVHGEAPAELANPFPFESIAPGDFSKGINPHSSVFEASQLRISNWLQQFNIQIWGFLGCDIGINVIQSFRCSGNGFRSRWEGINIGLTYTPQIQSHRLAPISNPDFYNESS